MRSLIAVSAAGLVAAAGITVLSASSTSAAESPARPLIALSANGATLLESTTAAPGTTTSVPVVTSGLATGESLVALALRPANGSLLGLGVNATLDTATLYVVAPTTGVLTRVGAASGQVAWTSDGVTPVDLPDPATAGYGIDINPTVDRVRVVASSGLNARINPDTGAPVDGNTGGGIGTNPDNSNALMAVASYTNEQAAIGGVTTEYALLPGTDQLAIINPPNDGTATMPTSVTLSGTPVNFIGPAGLDIPSDVRVTASNAAATGTAYAALTIGGTFGIYSLDLATGAATLLTTSTFGLRSLVVGEPAPAATPTPTPTATATPTPAAPATLSTTGKATQKKKTVLTGTTLTCPTASATTTCVAGVELTAKVTKKGKKKTVTIGSATVSVPKGSSAALSVKLSGKGKKLLKAAGTLKARVVTTAPTGTAGATVTTTVKIKLKAKKL